MGELLFLYDFEFVPDENPPGTKEQFEEGLRRFFESRDLDYGMSALGGMVSTRGDVRGRSCPVTEEDRRALAQWVRCRRVRCTARLGALEEDHADLELFREVTEWVFAIDNRSESGRPDAAENERRT
ncbi:MAG TPA: hypothetical protein VG406_28590 [Isosphaeraceae bacterium]|nr:hypothetical protein [Isosphaeraceae bacterium]